MTSHKREYQRVTRRVRVMTPKGWQWANVGDVIYSDGQGNTSVLTGIEAEQVHFVDFPPDHIADANAMVKPEERGVLVEADETEGPEILLQTVAGPTTLKNMRANDFPDWCPLPDTEEESEGDNEDTEDGD